MWDAEEAGCAEQPDPFGSSDNALGPVHVQPGIGDEITKINVGDMPGDAGVIQDPRTVQSSETISASRRILASDTRLITPAYSQIPAPQPGKARCKRYRS